VVRVEANQRGGAVYRRLLWAARGWRLIGVDFTEFE
jgi:hypothetical protein